MVQECIECGRIIDSSRIYCRKCEKDIKSRIEKRERFKQVYNNSDFFERKRIKGL